MPIKNKPKPFFTKATCIYRKDHNRQILKELTGDEFLVSTSYNLAHPEEFDFTCKKCGTLAEVIGVDFARRGKTVIFFFLECPSCNTRGFRKMPILKPFHEQQVTLDYKARKILYHHKGKMVQTRTFKVTGLETEGKEFGT
jgi:hypothetical protein